MRSRFFLSLGLSLCLLVPSANAEAQGGAPTRYSVLTPHSKVPAGAARVRVRASQRDVLELVTDFAHYSDFISKFEKVRVLGRTATTTDVYLQVPILKGAAKVWAVLRFGQVQKQGAEVVLEGHLLKGNVERLDAKWKVIEIDRNLSELRLEMLLLPKFPAPGSIITSEVSGAADNAVSHLRDAAERSSKATQK